MIIVLKRVIFILIICMTSALANESLSADGQLCMHNSRYTQSVSDSLQGCINQNDEFTVNEYSEETGAAHVTSKSGVTSGQSGWTSRESISNSLQGEQSIESTTTSSSDAFENPMDKAILAAIESGKAHREEINRDHLTPRSDEEIWEGTTGDNPRYRLAVDRYDGGDYIPFYQDSHDSFGTRTRTYHYVRADSEAALRGVTRLSTENQQIITARQASYCESGIHQTYSGSEGNWIPSCEVLQNENLTPAHQAQLAQCVTNMRAAINQGGSTRSNLFRNLYRKLNSREQEFAAMIFTTIGEARGENNADQVMVMKTINNRARYAQERGFTDANELDVVLQPWQFSMYNSNDPNWRRALENRSNDPALGKAIESYLLYRNTDFGEGGVSNSIYHYHTPAVNPNWRHQGDVITPRPNGETPSTHIFYSGVPWSFRHNEYRS